MGLFDFFASNSHRDNNKGHLKNLIAVAMSDGNMDANEAKVLQSVANRLGIDEINVRQIVANYKDIRFVLPKDKKDRIQQFWDLIMIILADGKISENETRAFDNFATELGIRKAISAGLIRKLSECMDKNEPITSFKGEFIQILTDGSSWE